MNKTKEDVFSFFEIFKKVSLKNEIVLCVPFVYIHFVPPYIKKGAQNCYYKNEGAFTGEISAKMLSSLGLDYIILGHSERRKIFKETNEEINLKILSALKNNLNVIVCIEDISCIKKCLVNVSCKFLDKIVVAYEPTNAIGTGNAKKIEDAEDVCKNIRKKVLKIYGNNAKKIRILYGGSVRYFNAKKYLSQKNIDGILVGGASLDAKEFLKICS